jgi:hypothetical protein
MYRRLSRFAITTLIGLTSCSANRNYVPPPHELELYKDLKVPSAIERKLEIFNPQSRTEIYRNAASQASRDFIELYENPKDLAIQDLVLRGQSMLATIALLENIYGHKDTFTVEVRNLDGFEAALARHKAAMEVLKQQVIKQRLSQKP